MKKIVAFSMVLIMVLSLISCRNEDNRDSQSAGSETEKITELLVKVFRDN